MIFFFGVQNKCLCLEIKPTNEIYVKQMLKNYKSLWIRVVKRLKEYFLF